MSKTYRKYGSNTDDRGPEGRFVTGNPGKPKGARHKATKAVANLLDKESDAITQKAIGLALDGDTTALRLCLERIAPPRKDSPVQFDLPPINTASEAAQAAQAVLSAVSQGDITPLEGASVMALVEGFRKTLELTEFEDRLKALEERT